MAPDRSSATTLVTGLRAMQVVPVVVRLVEQVTRLMCSRRATERCLLLTQARGERAMVI